MPKIARQLSALQVARLAAPGRHVVGGVPGLYLMVWPTGARSWVLRLTVAGKRCDLGLGSFPTVGLAEAREAAYERRKGVAQGDDPIRAKREALAARRAEVNFRTAAALYIEAKSHEWKNAKHGDQWRNTLDTYAYPLIGDLGLGAITTQHVLAVLGPIWTKKTETASRVRNRIELVLDWGAARGHRDGPNPARWKGHLDKLLAAPTKVAVRKHHDALSVDEVPGFMRALRGEAGMGARALEFAVLTAARSGEVRGALWSEIDLERALWTIPGERMKAGRAHRVPLSAAALALLQALPKFEGVDLVFASTRQHSELSDMTLSAVMRRMKVPATPHGFRSSFRDWAAERTSYPSEVAEMALAHVVGDKVEAAYRRGDLFEKRVGLMADWAGFCGA